MQMAIHAYISKQIQYKSKATGVFGVPKSTLQDRLKGMKSRPEPLANCHKLIPHKEEVLIKHMLDADKRGFSIRPKFLRRIAQILLRGRTQDPTTTIRVN